MANEENNEKRPQEGELDNLKKTRTILLSGEINRELSESVIRQLLILEADDSEKPVWIYINSPGGEVDSGFAIYDMMRFITCPVYVLGVGLVASAAALIYVAVPKERRFALPDSTYLIHQPLASMKGVASDVEIYADKLNKIKAKINKIIADATGKNVEDVANDTDRDYWLSAEEAVTYGLVSRVVKERKELV